MGALEVPRKVAHITVSYPPADLLYPTVPLTLLTVANLIAAWRDWEPRRRWWLGASAISIVERIATFSYFIPTMLWLTGIAHLSEAEVEAALSRWLLLDYGRLFSLWGHG